MNALGQITTMGVLEPVGISASMTTSEAMYSQKDSVSQSMIPVPLNGSWCKLAANSVFTKCTSESHKENYAFTSFFTYLLSCSLDDNLWTTATTEVGLAVAIVMNSRIAPYFAALSVNYHNFCTNPNFLSPAYYMPSGVSDPRQAMIDTFTTSYPMLAKAMNLVAEYTRNFLPSQFPLIKMEHQYYFCRTVAQLPTNFCFSIPKNTFRSLTNLAPLFGFPFNIDNVTRLLTQINNASETFGTLVFPSDHYMKAMIWLMTIFNSNFAIVEFPLNTLGSARLHCPILPTVYSSDVCTSTEYWLSASNIDKPLMVVSLQKDNAKFGMYKNSNNTRQFKYSDRTIFVNSLLDSTGFINSALIPINVLGLAPIDIDYFATYVSNVDQAGTSAVQAPALFSWFIGLRKEIMTQIVDDLNDSKTAASLKSCTGTHFSEYATALGDCSKLSILISEFLHEYNLFWSLVGSTNILSPRVIANMMHGQFPNLIVKIGDIFGAIFTKANTYLNTGVHLPCIKNPYSAIYSASLTSLVNAIKSVGTRLNFPNHILSSGVTHAPSNKDNSFSATILPPMLANEYSSNVRVGDLPYDTNAVAITNSSKYVTFSTGLMDSSITLVYGGRHNIVSKPNRLDSTFIETVNMLPSYTYYIDGEEFSSVTTDTSDKPYFTTSLRPYPILYYRDEVGFDDVFMTGFVSQQAKFNFYDLGNGVVVFVSSTDIWSSCKAGNAYIKVKKVTGKHSGLKFSHLLVPSLDAIAKSRYLFSIANEEYEFWPVSKQTPTHQFEGNEENILMDLFELEFDMEFETIDAQIVTCGSTIPTLSSHTLFISSHVPIVGRKALANKPTSDQQPTKPCRNDDSKKEEKKEEKKEREELKKEDKKEDKKDKKEEEDKKEEDAVKPNSESGSKESNKESNKANNYTTLDEVRKALKDPIIQGADVTNNTETADSIRVAELILGSDKAPILKKANKGALSASDIIAKLKQNRTLKKNIDDKENFGHL